VNWRSWKMLLVAGNPGHSFQYDDEIGELKKLRWLNVRLETRDWT